MRQLNLPSIDNMLNAGVHFGHRTLRWNPKMAPFIFQKRGGIHVLDLRKSRVFLLRAMEFIRSTVAGGGKILFVGTKPQARQTVIQGAERCGQYHVTRRWLGGTLTNYQTVSQSLKKLDVLEDSVQNNTEDFTKKEILRQKRELERLEGNLGGLRGMGGRPNAIIILDVCQNQENVKPCRHKESRLHEVSVIKEARRCGVPTIGIVDTNADPTGVDYPIPGNDDSARAIKLYMDAFVDAILAGMEDDLKTYEDEKDVASVQDMKAEDFTDQPTPEAKEKA